MERDFKGIWIPKEVWLDDRLNPLDKVILMEIDSLDNVEKGCYASNEYIAKFCQCSESKVAHTIARLIELGYISRESFDGRKRTLQSRLAKNAMQTSRVCNAELQNLQHSNIDNNIDIIIKKERKKEPEQEESYDSIIESATENEDLREAYMEFVKMRKLKKDPMTNHALHLLIGKAQKLSGGNEAIQKQMLEEAIINGWKSVYPLKEYNVPGCAAVKQKRQRPADAPAWVPDEIFEREDVRIFDTRMPPFNGSVTYMTKLGYGRIEPSSPEEAERIERLYSEWKQSGGKDWQWNGPCAD